MLYEYFLRECLGIQGAGALAKAAIREPAIGDILLPRTIIGWLDFVANYDYEGEVPGIMNSNITIRKNEDGSFTGSSTVNDTINFENSDLIKMTAILLHQLGGRFEQIDPTIKDKVIERLGKSIDTLVKIQELAKLKKQKELEKTDLPGKTAQPQKQLKPQAPVQPVATQSKIPRPASPKLPKVGQKLKMPSLKIGKSEATKKCKLCEGVQFNNNKFVGCICNADLAKSITTTTYSDGYVLDFKKNFDKEAFLVLLRYFNG